MTQEELNKLADLIRGSNMTKKASAPIVDRVKLNQEFNSLMEKGPFGHRQASAYFNQPLKVKVPYVAIAPKVLDEDSIGTDVAYGDLEYPELGASKVPFKGAPAYIERGPKRIWFNTHSDSVNWKIPYDVMATGAYDQLNHAKDKVGTALALSLDKEFMAQLEAIAATDVYTPLLITGALTLATINQIRAEQNEWDLFTKAIILSYSHYYDLLNVTSKDVDQVTLNTIIETGFVGNFYGVDFLVTRLCPKNVGYAVTDKTYLGKYVLRMPQQIKISDTPWNDCYVVTGYVNYGIILYNPPAVRKFTFA